MKPYLFRVAAVIVTFAMVSVGVAPRLLAAAPTDDEKRQAGAFYMEGERLFKQELYSAAIENFKKAHGIIPFPANLYNIARSYEKLGDAENCVDYYEQYVGLFKETQGKEPPDIVDVRASIQKCRLLMRPEVSIGSDPLGANVYINDKANLLGQTPYKTTLDPGTYTIYLALDGYVPFQETVEVRAGEPLKLFFKLERQRLVGTIEVQSNVRGATIFVDGRNVGLTPFNDHITVEQGPHQVTISKDEYIPYTREIDVVVNEHYVVDSEIYLRDAPTTWKGYVGWTSLVLGAGLGVGGFFAGQRAEDFFSGTDDFDQWATLQKVGYGAGGALIGIGIGLLIWEAVDDQAVKSEDDLTSVDDLQVWPILGPTPTGAMVGADVRF